MRVLLDECLPRKLKHELPGHEVVTVPEAGWAGKKNGELIQLASGRFDVLLTIDAGMTSIQSVSGLALAVIALKASSNRIEALRPLIGQLRDAVGQVRPGQLIRIVA